MSKYREWKNPKTGQSESVKLGWSWTAFLFGGFWAIGKRMIWLGIAMLVFGTSIGYAIALTQTDDNADFFLLAASLLLGLFFGAYGNSWRERNLRARGFVPGKTKEHHPLRTFFAHPVVGISTVWNDAVWSKVIAGIILGAGGAVIGFFLLSPSTDKRQFNLAQHNFSAPGCHSVTIYGHVEPNESETFAWFEWGETPDLGKMTIKQRFTEENEYYQVLVDLQDNKTYYYKAVVSNIYGTSEGRVNSVTTARC